MRNKTAEKNGDPFFILDVYLRRLLPVICVIEEEQNTHQVVKWSVLMSVLIIWLGQTPQQIEERPKSCLACSEFLEVRACSLSQLTQWDCPGHSTAQAREMREAPRQRSAHFLLERRSDKAFQWFSLDSSWVVNEGGHRQPVCCNAQKTWLTRDLEWFRPWSLSVLLEKLHPGLQYSTTARLQIFQHWLVIRGDWNWSFVVRRG